MDILLQQCSVAAQIDSIMQRNEDQVAKGRPSIFKQTRLNTSSQVYCDDTVTLASWTTKYGYKHRFLLSERGHLVSTTQYPYDGPLLVSAHYLAHEWSRETLACIAPGLDDIEQSFL